MSVLLLQFKYLITAFILIAPLIYLIIIVRHFWEKLKNSKLVLLVFVFLTVVFFNKLIFFERTLAQKDFNDLQVPFFHFFQETVKEDFLPPFWNDRFCGGFDNFANPLAGYFSVYNSAFLIFNNVYTALNLYIILQVFTCLVFAYLMLLTFGFKKPPALVGAVVFSFNAFVTMRLSPGVGIEYLFTYKWIPIILALFVEYKNNPSFKKVLLLSIPCAFLLEGNLNIVISSVLLISVFSVFFLKDLKPNILLLPVFSFLIYAVKLLPTLPVLLSSSISSQYQMGWRGSNYDPDMFPEIFFPIKVEFLNGYFTPGVIAISLFFFGLVVFLLKRKRKRAGESTYLKPFLLIFVLAFLLTIEENPLYQLFYSLPLLDKVTIIPSFTIFYILPIVVFSAYAFKFVVNKFGVVTYLIPALIFLEVLLGFSTFGPDSYSFNFAKMSYKTEPYDFKHFKVLSKLDDGYFFIRDRPDIFLYPYSVTAYDLKTLNTPAYFYGCRPERDYSKEADYVLTITPGDEYEFVEEVSLSSILNHESHSVFEHKMEYYKLYNTGWNDSVYIYRNDAKSAVGGLVAEEVVAEEQETANLNYISNTIILGFALSFCSFLFIILYFSRRQGSGGLYKKQRVTSEK
jgi:hypothetical protein